MPTFTSRVRRLIAAGALAICALAPAQAATFTPGNNGTTILMAGPIEEHDAEVLRAMIAGIEQGGFRVQWLFLDSPGGRMQEGLDIALILTLHGVNTVVGEGATCASACVPAFALGNRRVVYPTARIGVHGGSELNMKTGETKFSPDATIRMIRVLALIDSVPATVLVKIAVTPPEAMSWLGVEDYRAWNVEMHRSAPATGAQSNRRPLY